MRISHTMSPIKSYPSTNPHLLTASTHWANCFSIDSVGLSSTVSWEQIVDLSCFLYANRSAPLLPKVSPVMLKDARLSSVQSFGHHGGLTYLKGKRRLRDLAIADGGPWFFLQRRSLYETFYGPTRTVTYLRCLYRQLRWDLAAFWSSTVTNCTGRPRFPMSVSRGDAKIECPKKVVRVVVGKETQAWFGDKYSFLGLSRAVMRHRASTRLQKCECAERTLWESFILNSHSVINCIKEHRWKIDVEPSCQRHKVEDIGQEDDISPATQALFFC